MATTKHDISSGDGWVEIAADGEDFLVQNVTREVAHVTLQAAAPGAGVAYHVLQGNEAMVRVGTGAAYVRAQNAECSVVVTK